MSKHRVKGTVLHGIVTMLQQRRAEGRFSEEQLEPRLAPATLEVLDSKIQIGLWYPLEAYRELLDLYWEVESGRDPEFMRRQGATAARELVELGVYRAFLSTSSEENASTRGIVERARLTCRMTEMIYDFVEVEALHDPGAHTLTLAYRNVEGFDEAMVLATQGFLAGLTRIISGMDAPDSESEMWQVERPEAGRLRFTLDLARLVPREAPGA